MRSVDVKLESGKDRSYSILIENGVLDNTGALMAGAGLKGRVAVLTNPVVGPLYLERVVGSLKGAGFDAFTIEMPDGEGAKSLTEAAKIYDALIEEKMERGSVIVALGGGVTGDLAGFIAATYLRGVPYVQIPTTLLSQVDSSIGGKTAVNHPKGKNLIGSFYQPRLVIIDPEVLKTLAERELKAGLAEVVKHAVIRDKGYFEFLKENSKDILALSPAMIETLARSCEIKADVVSEDETEEGVRAILNFGHTFGHAIESVAGYGTFVHGEAVAMGMVLAAEFSVKIGLADKESSASIRALLEEFGLPTAAPDLKADDIMASMRLDKKVEGEKVRFVLLNEIGSVLIKEIDDESICSFLNESFQ